MENTTPAMPATMHEHRDAARSAFHAFALHAARTHDGAEAVRLVLDFVASQAEFAKSLSAEFQARVHAEIERIAKADSETREDIHARTQRGVTFDPADTTNEESK